MVCDFNPVLSRVPMVTSRLVRDSTVSVHWAYLHRLAQLSIYSNVISVTVGANGYSEWK